MSPSPKSKRSPSPHAEWVTQMAALQPGESMTLRESEVLQRGSTLRSAKMTMWNRARVLDRTIWFQKRLIGYGMTLRVTRPTEGQMRGVAGHVIELVEMVRVRAPGSWLSVGGPARTPVTRLRTALAAAGVAASVHSTPGSGYFVLRWLDEHLPRSQALSQGRGSTRHRELESALVTLPVGASVDVDYKPQVYRPVIRRYGLLLGVPFVTECARDATGNRVLRITRLAEPPCGSPLRPWLSRFKRLRPGQAYATSTAALTRAGTTLAGLSARLHGLAKRLGGKVSVTRTGGQVTVLRLRP